MTAFIALSEQAPELLAECNSQLRNKDGGPKHGAIASAAGVSRNTWWGVRTRTRGLGKESTGKLAALAVKSGKYTEAEAMAALFVVVNAELEAA